MSGKRFRRLAFYNILSNITVPLAGLVDTAMLGHLGEIRHLAGASLAAIIFNLVYTSAGFLRMGSTGMIAKSSGTGDQNESVHILVRYLSVGLLLGLAVLLSQHAIELVAFHYLKGESGVLLSARDYFRARIWGAPAYFMNLAFMGWFLGQGFGRSALLITLSGTITNVVLNYLFIVLRGMGAAGAGYATMASQYLISIIAFFLFLAGLDTRNLRLRIRDLYHRARLLEMFSLNGDIFLRTIGLTAALALFTDSASRLGETTLASNSILMQYWLVATFLIDGIAFALEAMAGQAFARGDMDDVRRNLQRGMVGGVGMGLLFALSVLTATEPLLRLITNHAFLVERAARYAPWLVPVLLFSSTAFILDGLFVGLARGRSLRDSMALSVLFVFIPGQLLAVRLGNNHLLWLSMVLFMAARTATLAIPAKRLLTRRAAPLERPGR